MSLRGPWRRRGCSARRRHRGGSAESGQVSLLVLGFTVVAILLVMGTVAVTSVQLSRTRLLDAADGAALDAADSLDLGAYHQGLDRSVALTDSTVRGTAVDYLAHRPRPESLLGWEVASGTGSPDGETAVVRLSGEARVPLVGGLLESVGGSVTITVESRARADLG